MSAFVCGSKHIAVVAQRVIEKYQVAGKPISVSDFAEKMARLNIESVDYLYKEKTDAKELAMFVAECREMADDPAISNEKFTDGRLLGLAGCFLYQSCESDECFVSETYRVVKRFEDYLEAKGVKSEGWSL